MTTKSLTYFKTLKGFGDVKILLESPVADASLIWKSERSEFMGYR